MVDRLAVESSIKVTIICYLIAFTGSIPAKIRPDIMPGRLTSPTVLAESTVGINEARMLSRISAAEANFGEAPRLSIS